MNVLNTAKSFLLFALLSVFLLQASGQNNAVKRSPDISGRTSDYFTGKKLEKLSVRHLLVAVNRRMPEEKYLRKKHAFNDVIISHLTYDTKIEAFNRDKTIMDRYLSTLQKAINR